MRRLSVGICVTALVTLVLELVLTRVFDVILSPNMAYMVITCAVLAFGLAGVYATLWPLSRRTNLDSVLAWLAALVAVTLVTLRPAPNFLPFNFEHVFTRPLRQTLAFGAVYLVLVIPFFVSGLILTTFGVVSLVFSILRLIGYPLYTYSVVIFVLLLAAGLGSRLSDEARRMTNCAA